MTSLPDTLRHTAGDPVTDDANVDGLIDRCQYCGTPILDRRDASEFHEPDSFKPTGVQPLAAPGYWAYDAGTIVERGRHYQAIVTVAPLTQTLRMACTRDKAVLDTLIYNNYVANRVRRPDIDPERWGLLACFATWRDLECRYQTEVALAQLELLQRAFQQAFGFGGGK